MNIEERIVSAVRFFFECAKIDLNGSFLVSTGRLAPYAVHAGFVENGKTVNCSEQKLVLGQEVQFDPLQQY